VGLTYLLALPAGNLGVILASASVLSACLTVNRRTLGVYLMLLASPLAGEISNGFGLYHVGGPTSFLIGLALAIDYSSREWRPTVAWRQPLLWLAVTIGVLFMSYWWGPQTEYSQAKLPWFVYHLTLALIAFSVLVNDRTVETWGLGFLAVSSSLLSYAVMGIRWPHFLPSSVWIPGGVRLLDKFGAELRAPIDMLSSMAGTGLILLLCGSTSAHRSRLRVFLTLLAAVAAALVINSSGKRKWMAIMVPAACVCVMLCRPKDKTVLVMVMILSLVAVLTVVSLGLAQGNRVITAVFDEGQSITERMNRGQTWDAAIERIRERPLWGHGLGGYYSDAPGFDRPGDGDYAHNLILELCSETGILGALLICMPVFVLVVRRWKELPEFRAGNGDPLLPLLAVIVIQSMSGSDLANYSYMFFAATATMWAQMVRRSPSSQWEGRTLRKDRP
jgi:hypothetical protein